MSGIGYRGADSNLPADVEAKIANVQAVISQLEAKIISADNQLESKKSELLVLKTNIDSANTEYNRVIALTEASSSSLSDREQKIAQKESALDVYAAALQEKEKKINKYLSIFESMKDVVIK